jgi:YD repeat-containing protein
MNQNGQIDPTDQDPYQDDDRITDTLQDALASGEAGTPRGTDIRRTRLYRFTANDSNATNLISMSEVSTDGLKSWQTVYRDASTPVTTRSETVYGANGTRTVTITHPDNSSTVSAYSYGRLSSIKRNDSGGGQVTLTTYAYDAHGRISSTTDARNGATSYAYNAADQVVTTTAPSLGTGQAPQVTTSYYDNLGRQIGQLMPDRTTTTNLYFVTGLLQKTWGSRTYPVEYSYDSQGRMVTMKTWQNFAAGTGVATTTWSYDTYRGWLEKKVYEGETDSTKDYEYTAAGQLWKRHWERGVDTTYAYNNAGDLSSVTYTGGSVSTPSTTYTYDRRGRRVKVVRNSITTTFTYNDSDQVLTESYGDGTLAGLSVNNIYDNYLRRTTVQIKYRAAVLQGVNYAYDTAGRVQTVTDGSASSYTATYAYQADSLLVNTVTFKEGANNRLITTKNYDKLNRLTLISSTAYGASAPSLPMGFAYQYNSANQRTRIGLTDGSYWVYQYDALGQVISGRRYWSDGTPVDGQQFDYVFDDIGNRTATGGRASSVSSYTPNLLNQYIQRTVPDKVDIQGIANPTAGVTVNGNTANRKGEYFHCALTMPNSSVAYPTVTVVSQYGAGQTDSGKVYVAPATESYAPDADGNLLNDGRWTYSWEGENRLVEIKRDVDQPSGARQKLVFEYDHQGRRIRKQFFSSSSHFGGPRSVTSSTGC